MLTIAYFVYATRNVPVHLLISGLFHSPERTHTHHWRCELVPHQQFKYVRYNRTDLPAHIYAISAAAYWALCEGQGLGHGPGCHQTIMLAGESGSGKSFTASLILDHLMEAADIARGADLGTAQDSWGMSDGSITDENNRRGKIGRLRRLVACQRIILESFGNAHTVSEDSSRRGVVVCRLLRMNRRGWRLLAGPYGSNDITVRSMHLSIVVQVCCLHSCTYRAAIKNSTTTAVLYSFDTTRSAHSLQTRAAANTWRTRRSCTPKMRLEF